MYVVLDNIVDYMRNAYFTVGCHLTIEFTSKWLYVVLDSIVDYMRDAYFTVGCHLTIEFTSKWLYVGCGILEITWQTNSL